MSKDQTELGKLQEAMVRLLDVVGRRSTCKGCERQIWWIKTRVGKMAPYTEEGINHFADCPKASRFRK